MWFTMSGLLRYSMIRVINVFIVLIAILAVTYSIMAPIADRALIEMWREQLRMRLMSDPKLVRQITQAGKTIDQWVEEQLQVLIKRKGLDKPWYLRLPGFILRCLRFELGKSYQVRSFMGTQDIATIIFERVPFSVLLFTTSSAIMAALGVLFGIRCASSPGRKLDTAFMLHALVGGSLPQWWVGMLLILFLVYMIPLFPPPRDIVATIAHPPPIVNVTQFLHYVVRVAYCMTLPLLTVILVNLGGWVYIIRNIVLTTLTEDFVFVARAKGVPERDVLYKHVLRASAPPIITMILLSLTGSIFGGAIITETVFMWPGMGLLYWDAIANNDTPLVLGLTYVSSLIYLITILILDILYGILDPRVRVTGGISR